MRAVVAARISNYTDESVSIQRQIKSGEAYAVARSWEVAGYVRDEDVSASKVAPFDQPDLKVWLDKPDSWDVLIFWKLDRIVRSPADLTDMVRWCEKHGKSLVFVDDGFDLSTPIGEAMAYVAAVFAKMEVQRTSERLVAANKELRGTTRWQGGRAPYGYMSVPAEDGKGRALVQDAKAVAVVRWIAERFLAGDSLNSVAESLNKRGVPSPQDHHRLKTDRKVQSAKWAPTTLRDMLLSPALLGVKTHGGKSVIGADGMPLVIAEPIFTEAGYAALAERLTSTARVLHPRTAGVASKYLGVLVCKCGSPWYRSQEENAPEGQASSRDRYICSNKSHKRGEMPDLPPTMVIKAVTMHALVEGLLLQVYGETPRKRREFVPGEDHTAELARVEKSIERLRDDREAGDYDNDEAGYRSRMDRLRENRDRLRALPQRPDSWELVDTGEKWSDWWRRVDDEERRQELIRAGVRVYVYRSRDTKKIEIGILADPAVGERLGDPSSAVAAGTPPVPPLT